MKVGFIGVGKLGQPCSEVMAEKYLVEGYDVEPRTPRNFAMVNSLEAVVKDKDLIFVAIPTPHDPIYGGETPSMELGPKDFDYVSVGVLLKKLNRICNKNQLVVLISTVLPGTTRTTFAPLAKNYRFIYNPYLIAMGSTAWDMVNPEMVIIGTEDGSETGDAKILRDFYAPLMQNNPRFAIGTWDEAEAIKIFYNTFISMKIGFVNMIQDVAETNGNINVDVVTQALAKSTHRITGEAYLKAGMGDAGACHPRDNIALRYLANRLDLGYDLFAAIMGSREAQAERLANRLEKEADLLDTTDVYIHGKAYKPAVSYIEGSYSLLIAYYLTRDGYTVHYVDPLTNDFIQAIKGVVLMAHHAPTTYGNTAMQIRDTQSFYCDILPGSIIVDPWRYLKQEDVPGCKLVSYGNTR